MLTNDQIALIAGAVVCGPIIAIAVWMWYLEIKGWFK